VIQGACERCDSVVEQKDLEQWFFKITDYADKLLQDIGKLDEWPERVKTMQSNWIGKSRGVEIDFKVDGSDKTLTCFTTRVDTLFGATYMVLAPGHPDLPELLKDVPGKEKITEAVKGMLDEASSRKVGDDVEKQGVFTGRYVINPVTARRYRCG
jgi:leucyl-tRNA synthetase